MLSDWIFDFSGKDDLSFIWQVMVYPFHSAVFGKIC